MQGDRRKYQFGVYKKKLSEQFFVAPSTGYFVQPITVEKDFQNEFTSAYRSKSYVSELNSAYFIYNSEDPQLRAFQEQRFEVLRKAKSFTAMNQEMFSSKISFMSKKTLKESIASLEEKLFEAKQANNQTQVKAIEKMLKRFKKDTLKPNYTRDKK